MLSIERGTSMRTQVLVGVIAGALVARRGMRRRRRSDAATTRTVDVASRRHESPTRPATTRRHRHRRRRPTTAAADRRRCRRRSSRCRRRRPRCCSRSVPATRCSPSTTSRTTRPRRPPRCTELSRIRAERRGDRRTTSPTSSSPTARTPTCCQQLDTLGIAHWEGPAAVTLDDIYAQIEQLGAATGHVAEAAELVGQMQTDIADGDRRHCPVCRRAADLLPRARLDTFFSATSDTFIGLVYSQARAREHRRRRSETAPARTRS